MSLIDPHGGDLVDLLASEVSLAQRRQTALGLPVWELTPRQVCDLELLLNGGFSPLRGFMGHADYASVCDQMRLESGLLWPMPITLDVPESFAESIAEGQRIALRHPEGMILAVLTVEEKWRPDLLAEARAVFGTTDEKHPGVFSLKHQTHPIYLGGPLEGLELPPHHTHRDLRQSPRQLRQFFATKKWQRVVAFQTRNPLHRAHVELISRAAKQIDGHALIQPVVGMTKPGDVDANARVRCYRAVRNRLPAESTALALLPLAMRMGGPREAVWHAIVRKNYGCTHFIVGRDHAGPGTDSSGAPFYGPEAALELATGLQDELGIGIVPFREMVCVKQTGEFVTRDDVPAGAEVLTLSGTELRRRLQTGEPIPEWFTFPEVAAELRREFPPRHEQGFCVFFTGLPSAGKSTVANVLVEKLIEATGRPVSLLDGDIVRTNLSKGLGFSKADRDANITRIGFVAAEIVRHRGIAICAPIAPYAAIRRQNRERIGSLGGYVEVHVATPLEICEQRDRKGMYAKARAGEITGFTGIDDPYEAPESPEVRIDAGTADPETCANAVVEFLQREGYLPVALAE